MGYYIDFVFDKDAVKDYREVVKKFCDAGAKTFDIHDRGTPPQHSYVELVYPGLPGFINVFKEEAKNLRGNWADIRMSWGTKPEEMRENIKRVLVLALKLKCRVYDGHIKEYVVPDNVDLILGSFARGARRVENMIGFIDTKKYKKAHEDENPDN